MAGPPVDAFTTVKYEQRLFHWECKALLGPHTVSKSPNKEQFFLVGPTADSAVLINAQLTKI